jgi:hypothetical protein
MTSIYIAKAFAMKNASTNYRPETGIKIFDISAALACLLSANLPFETPEFHIIMILE